MSYRDVTTSKTVVPAKFDYKNTNARVQRKLKFDQNAPLKQIQTVCSKTNAVTMDPSRNAGM